MNKNSIASKWAIIYESQVQDGFKSLRLSPDCIPDLYIGISPKNERCLLLFLPYTIEVKLKKTQKRKLKIEFLNSRNIVIIILTDNDFSDLFDDLIVSLFKEIQNISDPQEYSTRLLAQFYKWAAFFEDSPNQRLSDEEIKGLWGELQILLEMLDDERFGGVNVVLKAWRGPYDTSNDFIFNNKNYEIKTRDEINPSVRISSEYQLEQEYEKGLDLIVLTIIQDLILGSSLQELIRMVVARIWEKLGELTIFYQALLQKGLTVENSMEYNNYRFSLKSKSTFDCTKDDFPKLVKSNIPPEISNIKYKLHISSLKEFLTEEKIY